MSALNHHRLCVLAVEFLFVVVAPQMYFACLRLSNRYPARKDELWAFFWFFIIMFQAFVLGTPAVVLHYHSFPY